MSGLEGTIRTFDDVSCQLTLIEVDLGGRFGITENIRESLQALDRAGNLPEDELVADWHDMLASYLNFMRYIEVVRTTDMIATRHPPSPEVVVLRLDGTELARLPPAQAMDLAHRIAEAAVGDGEEREYSTTKGRMFSDTTFDPDKPIRPKGDGWYLLGPGSVNNDGDIAWTWYRDAPKPRGSEMVDPPRRR